MRYILDHDGYIYNVSFGAEISCSLGDCAEYTGQVPADYETLEEWHDAEIERLNAWEIVEGNLVFDASKEAEIQERCEQQEKENSYVTHKEIEAFRVEQDENLKELYDKKSLESTYFNRLDTITNSSNLDAEKIELRTIDGEVQTENIKLFFTNENMLPNTATSKTISNVTFSQNNDKSIDINGTSTEEIEYDIAGSRDNTNSIMALKKDVTYCLTGIEPIVQEITGKELVLRDCDGSELVEFELDGNSYQETRSGKNLIDNKNGITETINGVTFTKNSDGTITANGTASAGVNYYVNGVAGNWQTLSAGTYYLSNGITNGESDSTYFLYLDVRNNSSLFLSTIAIKTRTYSETIEFRTRIVVRSGVTLNNVVFKPMLENGNVATEYEPPGAMPSPNYPSEAKNIETYNLFDKNNAKVLNSYHWSGSVLTGADYLRTTYINCKPNTTYTISKMAGQRFALGTTEVLPANGVQTYGFAQNNGATELSLTTPSNAKYLIVGFYNTNVDTVPYEEMLNSIKIVEGSVMQESLPYGTIGLKNAGKNLLNTSLLLEANADKTYSGYGFWAFKITDKLETFTLSRETNVMHSNGGYLAIGQGEDIATAYNNKVWMMHPSIQGLNSQSKTITNTGELWVFTGNSQNIIDNMLSCAGYLQLEKGSTATGFEMYKEIITTIDLQGNFVGKLPSGIKDRLYLENGRLYLEKKVVKIVFDGNEGWIKSSITVADSFAIQNQTIKPSSIGMSNYFTYLLNQRNVGTFYIDQFSQCIFSFSEYGNTSLEEWKSWLQELDNNGTPLTMYAELAEAQIIDLGEYSLNTLSGNSTIQLLSTLETNMHCKYLKDITLRMYDYDGTERTLLGEYSNKDVINVEETQKITQITLHIDEETPIKTTIYPMLQEVDQLAIDSEEFVPYVAHKSNVLDIDLGQDSFISGDQIIVENGAVLLNRGWFVAEGDIIYPDESKEVTLYFNFPNELYKDLPSEDTTIIQFGISTPRIYVLDKKIYLEHINSDGEPVTISLYDNENNINLTNYSWNTGSTEYYTITSVNETSEVSECISSIKPSLRETHYLKEVDMPHTYYKTTNVYSEKDVLIKITYRNIEELNTQKIKLGTFSITDDGLKSDIITEWDITTEDTTKVSNYILGTGTLTYTEKLKYDLDGDGIVSAKDLLLMRKLQLANITVDEPGTLEINSKSPFKTILLKDKDENEIVNLSLLGIKTPLVDTKSLLINGREYGQQDILWSGGYFMRANQSIDLSDNPISDQPHGIVLVWSYYSDSVEQDYNFNFTYVPKEFISLHEGKGISCFLTDNATLGTIGCKYVYVNNTSIVGNDNNDKTGTGGSGITYSNNKFVLRYVLSV